MIISIHTSSFFFFNDTATTEIYTLSLHDALPILRLGALRWYWNEHRFAEQYPRVRLLPLCLQHGWDAQKAGSIRKQRDRKSTRLNSSHSQISYAVFCLKKKKNKKRTSLTTS